MTENMKNFLQKVSEDKALIKRLAGLNKAGLIAVAKELGIELTDMDFPVSHEEIADAQLIGVTGGEGHDHSWDTMIPLPVFEDGKNAYDYIGETNFWDPIP